MKSDHDQGNSDQSGGGGARSTFRVADSSSDAASSQERRCAWCRVAGISTTARYCTRRCRQAAFRLRRRSGPGVAHHVPDDTTPRLFAYADPPYPGLAARYYSDRPDFGGEVDHRALVASLTAASYAGWALSTSSKALRDVLPLCPPGARVCAWVKCIGVPPATAGLHSTWEPVIVVGGRQRRPGVRDWLRAMPARGWGDLPGRKPIAFCAWLFDCLGMQPGDSLIDLFPGSGAVSRAWGELSSRTPATGRRWLPAVDDTPGLGDAGTDDGRHER